MSDLDLRIGEAALRTLYGEPSCDRCTKRERCLVNFMGSLIKIEASYVAAPGCGQFEPDDLVMEEETCRSKT